MGILRISLFGNFRVTNDSWQKEIKLTRTIQLLLAYMVLERNRLHSRDVLLDLFWSDYSPERARNCLNTALWRLRKVLEPLAEDKGKYLVTSLTGEIGFNLKCDCWVDVAVFENVADQVLKEPVDRISLEQVKKLEEVLALYIGDMLEGVYEDWALVAREHHRLLYIRSLDYLMHYYRYHAAYPTSIQYGKAILELDPLREEVHRDLMQLYMDCGQRSLAVRQYETCRHQLQDELGIPPMEETRTLYGRIVEAPLPPIGNKLKESPAQLSPNGDLRVVLSELHQASKNLELANKQFSQILRKLEKYTSSHPI
jgi:DNA-binding SARP family transcriptional activator